MLKWLVLLLVLFVGNWLFTKDYIPEKVRYGTFGTYVNAVLYNLEYSQLLKNKETQPKVVSTRITTENLKKLFDTLQGNKERVVYFFYDSNCFFCKIGLKKLNDVILKYKNSGEKIYYVVVAFDDDEKKVNAMLSNNYKDLQFRPIIIEAGAIRSISNYFSKKSLQFSETPTIIFKDSKQKYEIITTDFTSFDEIDYKIESKL